MPPRPSLWASLGERWWLSSCVTSGRRMNRFWRVLSHAVPRCPTLSWFIGFLIPVFSSNLLERRMGGCIMLHRGTVRQRNESKGCRDQLRESHDFSSANFIHESKAMETWHASGIEGGRCCHPQGIRRGEAALLHSKLSYFWSLVLHFDIDHRFVAMVQCCWASETSSGVQAA